MKHLGDITKINGAEVEPVDIIVGGSPCQDLSVAGLRAGLAGARSGLFMEQIRIVKEMRENDRVKNGRTNATARPRYMVWENVPGAFSSNKGEDFRAVLEETAKIADENAIIPRPAKGKWTHAGCIVGDGWSIAWRLHDAQFWGVPQRRKRIALVADFAGESAAEILFECESVPRDIEPCGKEGQEIAGAVEDGIRKAGEYANAYTLKVRGGVEIDSAGKRAGKGALIQTELSGTLGVSQDQTLICREPVVCLNDQGGAQMDVSEEVTGTLRAQTHGHESIVFELGAASRTGGHIYEDGVAGTLRANAGDNQQAVCYGFDGYNQTIEEEKAQSLRASDGGDSTLKVVCYGIDRAAFNQGQNALYNFSVEEEKAQTIVAKGPGAVLYSGLNDGNGCNLMGEDVSPTLVSTYGTPGGTTQDRLNVIALTTGMTPNIDENEVAFSLLSRDYKDMQCVAYRGDAITSPTNASNPQPGDACHTLSTDGRNYVVYDGNRRHDYKPFEEVCETIQAHYGTGGGNCPIVHDIDNYVVRRLTPLECERLQGFPDGWTDIGDWIDSKGKKHKGEADAPRYKALGNSIALPFWQWMAERMVAQLDTDKPTMASLFDGIGGFPLVYSRCGCRPVWASEIEEFPIAVTKVRFPDDRVELQTERTKEPV